MADTRPAAGGDDCDLDALLDEAMDIVDEQEREHEAHVKQRDAELDKKLQAALQDSGHGGATTGGGDGGDEVAWLGEMMRTVEEMKSSLSDDMDEATFATLKGKIDTLLHRVEESGMMTGDDKGEFASVKTLLDMLGNDPQQSEQLAQALGLDKLPDGVSASDAAEAAAAVAARALAGGSSSSSKSKKSSSGDEDDDAGDGAEGAEGGDDADGQAAARLRAALEQLKADPEHFAEEARQMLAERTAAARSAADGGNVSASGPGAAAATSTTASTAAAAASEVSGVADAMKDNLARMLLTTFRDPQFVEPVRVMRDAYARWLAAHDAALSEADKERYRKQHAMTIAICDFLAVPLSDTDDERVVQLMEMMHEFSQLGEPPSDLATFDQQGSGAEDETGVVGSDSA